MISFAYYTDTAIFVCEAKWPSYFSNSSRDLSTRHCDFDCTMKGHNNDHPTRANTYIQLEDRGHFRSRLFASFIASYMLINGLISDSSNLLSTMQASFATETATSPSSGLSEALMLF